MSKTRSSFGLSGENAELFHKVQEVIGNMSEKEIANHPESIYEACKRSNKFSNSELDTLSSVYTKESSNSLIDLIIKSIKKIFKL